MNSISKRRDSEKLFFYSYGLGFPPVLFTASHTSWMNISRSLTMQLMHILLDLLDIFLFQIVKCEGTVVTVPEWVKHAYSTSWVYLKGVLCSRQLYNYDNPKQVYYKILLTVYSVGLTPMKVSLGLHYKCSNTII